VLDGARAVFDSEYQLILHEDAGSPFEQAFLVAHEIGHTELGDDEGDEVESAVHIDPSRTAEAAPVGLDRVEDYSRRQRREVQMDLFAREFLLPRPVVRLLHVEQGMTCSDIANKLGAPFDVVAQQMFDALLLPTIVPTTAAPMPEIPLNDKQRAAAYHRGKAFLLQAGPGTGKTRTLVARVEGLLDEGVDPRRILLLTFSNKAAAEMAERIAQKRPKEAAALWIGTFHGFGLDLLRRFNDLCGLPADPKLMDRTEAVELLENEFPRLGLVRYRNLFDPSQTVVDMLGAISRAKDDVVDAASYLRLAQAMALTARSPSDIEIAKRAAEVAQVFNTYEMMKSKTGCVDFGDLVMRPVLLLEKNDAVRRQLQESYDHVLVDEYQDVNRSSIRLLTALKPDGTNLWAVGDAKQSIYRFRGASSFNMSRFGQQDFADGLTDSLEINYRSTPEIVNTFSAFAAGMTTGGVSGRLQAYRSVSGSQPELRTVADGALVSPALADCIEELKTAGIGYRDQAVLCRGNDKLSEVGQELERLDIPVLFLGSLFERPEVKDLVAMLSLLVDRRAMGLVRMSCWPEFAMSIEETIKVFEHLRGTQAEAGAWMSDVLEVSPSGALALSRLKSALQGFDGSSNPWQVLAHVLLDRTRIAANIASSNTVADQAHGIAIWQFMNFVRVQPKGQGLPITRLMERIRRLLRLRDERDLRQLPAAAQGIDAVRLMTIHGSKGLEFPAVHLVGTNQDTMPGTFRPPRCAPPDGMIVGAQGSSEDAARAAHNEEQECLFYVAMSRAKDRLFFYGATSKSNGTKRNLSEFLVSCVI
jgi:superfamily I DNA/RNA helicase